MPPTSSSAAASSSTSRSTKAGPADSKTHKQKGDEEEQIEEEEEVEDDVAGEDEDDEEDEEEEEEEAPPNPLDQKAKDREARFKALRARAKNAASSNLQEVFAERRRQTLDPRTLSRLQRLRSEAEFKLAKSEVVESGGDFERKRAWDWTAEEAALWDRKLAKKAKHREDVAFQDYTQAARKQYKKQVREMGGPDLVGYKKEKAKLIRDGQVYEVEGEDDDEDGEKELVAVDRDGEFYAGVDSLGFVDNKPRKDKIDKLVGDLKKEEEKRSKRGRGKDGEEDITYINDKNKQFNMKLARYYNKYTGEIRDSFERGTMI